MHTNGKWLVELIIRKAQLTWTESKCQNQLTCRTKSYQPQFKFEHKKDKNKQALKTLFIIQVMHVSGTCWSRRKNNCSYSILTAILIGPIFWNTSNPYFVRVNASVNFLFLLKTWKDYLARYLTFNGVSSEKVWIKWQVSKLNKDKTQKFRKTMMLILPGRPSEQLTKILETELIN